MDWTLEQDGFSGTCSINELVAIARSDGPSAVVFNMHDAKDEKRERIEQLRPVCDGVCVIDVYERNQPDVGADGYIIAPLIAAVSRQLSARILRTPSPAPH